MMTNGFDLDQSAVCTLRVIRVYLTRRQRLPVLPKKRTQSQQTPFLKRANNVYC